MKQWNGFFRWDEFGARPGFPGIFGGPKAPGSAREPEIGVGRVGSKRKWTFIGVTPA